MRLAEVESAAAPPPQTAPGTAGDGVDPVTMPGSLQQPGRRIAVVGTSGSGKSHVARTLARRLGLTYVCNDTLIWRPHWTPTPRHERPALFDAALPADGGWTFDGNFSSMKDPEDHLILARIDTLVWLDLPRWLAHTQLLGRTVRRAWTHEPLWHDNRESWRQSFASRDSILLWALRSHAPLRRRYRALVADTRAAHVRVIRLSSRSAVNRWLEAVSPSPRMC